MIRSGPCRILLLVGGALIAVAAGAQSGRGVREPVDEANPLVGTAPLDRADLLGNAPPPGEPAYSGQTSPGARVPHSGVEVAPVNVNIELNYPFGVPTPYHYPNATMIGFTAGGGPTYGGRAKPLFMPVVGDWTVPPAYTQVHYDKTRETAAPGYYSVALDGGTVVELTATRLSGLMKFAFPKTDRAAVLINLPRAGGTIEVVGDRVIRGLSAPQGDRETADGPYFVAEFSRPFSGFGTFRKAPGDGAAWGIGDKDVEAKRRSVAGSYAGGYLNFAAQRGETVLVKVAHGHSYAEAEARLRSEQPGWDFAGVRGAARAAWAQLLDKVKVTGGTPRQRQLFYSTLFQSFASPRLIARKGERLMRQGGGSSVMAYDRYSPVPYWDTARNQLTLLELVAPDLVAATMRSELETARERGYMNTSFHGDHAVLMYLGAMERGIRFDYADAYAYLRKNATDVNGPRGYLAEYAGKGWISDIVPAGNPSPPYAGGKAGMDKTLEYAWDDHALAELARRLGKTDDAAFFAKRGANWRNVFDRSIGFMRGRTADGNWIAPFDPGEPYYNFASKEASGWSNLWLVPHDVNGLIGALGGRAAFNAKLDAFFTTPYAPKGICRDCTGLIGQYVQGNQPDQHAPYLYAWSGQPWKTQALVRRVLADLYGSDAAGYGYPGMDDQGSTSSWYALSAMGFYPVDPSTPAYIIGSPIFDRVRLTMGNGKMLEIVARNTSAANMYIQSATLNGRPWTKPWFSHADIRDGATLALVMGPKPNTAWGSAAADAPPSATRATVSAAGVDGTAKGQAAASGM